MIYHHRPQQKKLSLEMNSSPSDSRPRQEWSLDAELDALDPSDGEDEEAQPSPSVPLKKVPAGDIFEAARAGDVDRLRYLLESGVNVNARDQWDSVALYYTCLAGHVDAARLLLDSGAICSERTFDGDRCHYAALNLRIRRLLKAYEARPPPLRPLFSALRAAFLCCPANRAYLQQCDASAIPGYSSLDDVSEQSFFPPDVTFFVEGRAIEAHRVILSARSPFFKTKFETDWKERKEVRFSRGKLSFPALYSLIHFFYSDRLEVAVNDMEDLVRLCKACRCKELQELLQKELRHQQNADYKALREVDDSQKRFILQGSSLPEQDRLPPAMRQILQASLSKSKVQQSYAHDMYDMQMNKHNGDLADVCIEVDKKIFHCHQIILASRSEYFKARLFRMEDFLEGGGRVPNQSLPCLEEHDLSADAFEKMLEYMYTDCIEVVDPDQAEEIFDAASRYLLFPLKRAAADVLLPHLELAAPAEICHWLILSDMYGVLKLREYCLDAIACNFETFADTRGFRALLLTLPPPSGDSSIRTTVPSAPGTGASADQGNILDDLREKWLEAEGAELDKRDESAALFDKRLEMLILVAEQETRGTQSNGA